MLVPAIIIWAGTAIVIVGMLLPWLQGSAEFGVSFSTIGLQMDGIWLGAAALLTAGFTGAALLRDPSRFASVVVGFLVAVEIGLVAWLGSELSSTLNAAQPGPYAQSIGPGIYVSAAGVLVSAVGAGVAALMAFVKPSV